MRYFKHTDQKKALALKIQELEERLFALQIEAQISHQSPEIARIETQLERLYQFEDYLNADSISASPVPFTEWVQSHSASVSFSQELSDV